MYNQKFKHDDDDIIGAVNVINNEAKFKVISKFASCYGTTMYGTTEGLFITFSLGELANVIEPEYHSDLTAKHELLLSEADGIKYTQAEESKRIKKDSM